MNFTIVGSKMHITMTPEEQKRLTAELVSKREAKLKAGPFTAIFEVIAETSDKAPPSHTPIETELP